ncbi:MAG: transcription termination factor NusA [Elusimicrobiota bacterium]|jgi:N utilization substance protein A|nr:transcription termination factor NusA [Elusimicrobiota bacterium]
MADKRELLAALEQIEKDKKLEKKVIIEIIESALVSAYKKLVGKNVNACANINLETGEMTAYALKMVVEDGTADNPLMQIELSQAQKIDPDLKIGDMAKLYLNTQDFARIAAQTAKNVIIQRIKELERSSLYEEMKNKIGHIISGNVYRVINKTLIIDMGRGEGILPVSEQVPKEKFVVGQHIRAVVVSVRENENKAPATILSRKTPELVKKLFEIEVPEIYEKIVEIKSVVREAGLRSKVSVISKNLKVDPVGACVGVKGARIRPIIDELGGSERIDLIAYSDNPVTFIANALTPAKVISVSIVSTLEKKAEAVVGSDMLSLAIGKNGHNVRLAAKLTGWHIDVKTEAQRKEELQQKNTRQIAALEQLEGLNDKTIEVLAQAGFTNIEKLKTLSVEDLTTLPGIGPKTAGKIIEAAKAFSLKAKAAEIEVLKNKELDEKSLNIPQDEPSAQDAQHLGEAEEETEDPAENEEVKANDEGASDADETQNPDEKSKDDDIDSNK